jgi:putative ABC transport system permease protein
MTWWHRLLHRKKYDEELDKELRFHLDQYASDLIARGLAPEEARRQARLAFGGPQQVKEMCREALGMRWLEDLLQDVRYGARVLLKNPGFSLVAIITLGLGIGANTAIFSFVNAVLLRPLPYPEPERLVWAWGNIQGGTNRASVNPLDFIDYQTGNQSFAQLAASFSQGSFATLTGSGAPERLRSDVVTANYFDVLGFQPALGQGFIAEHEQTGRGQVVILSEGLWRRRFGGDPSLIGKALTLNGESFTVIGVMPADFQPPQPAELWVPMPVRNLTSSRKAHFIRPVGRLRPGVTLAAAQAEMDGIARRLEETYPEDKNWSLRLVPLQEHMVGNIRQPLWTLLGAVGFVLLIACANVANLMLARAASRHREIAVRAAMGASRRRIVRQLLTESLLLSLVGGLFGVLLGVWTLNWLVSISAGNIPDWVRVGIDARVLGFTLAATMLTGLLCGLAPALQASRPNLVGTLKEGARGASDGKGHKRVRGLWVVCEVALAVVLLVGAGLLIRSFIRLQQVDPGFDAKNVFTLRLDLPEGRYKQPEQVENFYDQLQQQLAALPGVEAVGTVSELPMSGQANDFPFHVEGAPRDPDNFVTADYRRVNQDYFRAMKIPLLRGRQFTAWEARTGSRVVVISEEMAEQFFPDTDPLGKRLVIFGDDQPYEIIGIAGDVRHSGLTGDVYQTMYAPSLRRLMNNLVIRTAGPPLNLEAEVRRAVRAADKDVPIPALRSMEELVGDSVAQPRMNTLLLSALAGLALALALVGIYGVTSYSVAQRTHEIGVRMALGAQARAVLRLVVTQGMRLAFVGVLIGLLASFALTRLMSSLLFGVSANDPLTFGGVALLLLLIALLACYLPARRAMEVDPLVALRHD